MNTRYVDGYVVCPFYSYDETNEIRKIHCQGYENGIHVQMYFSTNEQKKNHKKSYCNNKEGYKQCPLCKGNLAFYENKVLQP